MLKLINYTSFIFLFTPSEQSPNSVHCCLVNIKSILPYSPKYFSEIIDVYVTLVRETTMDQMLGRAC